MNIKSIAAAVLANASLVGFAYGHATLEVRQATVNSYYKAVVRVPHGCDGQATLKVTVTVPEGMISTRPMPKAGWKMSVVTGEYANKYELHHRPITKGVKQIIWEGSLEDGHFDEFVFMTRLTDKLPVGGTLYVPIVQDCADGQVAWVEIPKPGQNAHSLKRPAAGLKIMAAKHAHGHAAKPAMKKDGKMEMKAMKHEGMITTHGSLEISQPVLIATPPNAPVGGGYLTIKNNGKEADVFLGGSAEFAGRVEVHEMKMKGQIMRMGKVKGGLEIPAGSEVVLKSSGLHLMLMKLKGQLKKGEMRKVTLNFKKAGKVELNFAVKDRMDLKHANH